MFGSLVKRAALAIALMLAPMGASAYAQTIVVGGPGGGNFNDQCAPGALLVGVDTLAGKDMNEITAMCQNFVNGHAAGPIVRLRTWGHYDPRSTNTYALEEKLTCPPDMAAEGMDIQVSNVALVHSVALFCRNPNLNSYVTTHYSPASGGAMKYHTQVGCGGGALSSGLVGRYGALVDALGMNCVVAAPH